MESLDYNYYGAAMPPSYQYMSYDANPGLAQPGNIPASIEPHAFVPGSFDYAYHPAIPRTGLTPVPQTSASPPPPQRSQLPHGSLGSAYSMDIEDRSGRRSSSEEKDNLSPAQSRRKAQNRAAQRAFRERKERHVRDLEAKLDLLTTTTSSLQADNERLKLMLRRAQSENEILRAKISSSPSRRQPSIASRDTVTPHSARQYQITTNSSGSGVSSANGLTNVRNLMVDELHNEGNLLPATAAWDIIQTHPLYLSGTLDIGRVCERLKERARSSGMGPLFEPEEVRGIVDEIGRSCEIANQ